LRQPRHSLATVRSACLVAATSMVALLSGIIVPSSTETAVANGDTRTLNLYHTHTGESIQATFRVNGSYDPAVLEKLNYFLRDWRNNDRTRMDPRLFDVIWEAYRTAGATQPINIVSAYRSPQTNAMLRARSHAVAEHSQHILGRAMDTTMPGMPMARIREIGMRLQRGGVGWYPSENFVHLDVGNVRAWPRMSYDQLVRLFPDGKTVHLAADGRMLSRYQEARAEIASRGGVMADVPQSASSGSGLFAWLFGKHDEERGEEKEADVTRPPASRPGKHGAIEVASASSGNSEIAAPVANTAPVPAPEKNTSRIEPAAATANRTIVADLGSPASSRDSNGSAAGRDQNAAANGILTAGKRWTTASVPLPPARPALSGDNIALASANVPVPPARPASLTRVAALTPDPMQGKDGAPAPKTDSKQDAKLDVKQGIMNDAVISSATTPANTSLARAASLPVVITQGPKDHLIVPPHVLAFASATETPVQETQTAVSKTPGQTPSRSTTQAAARADWPRTRGTAGGVAIANFPAPSILGPSFTGLRRAARVIPGALSNMPAVAYVPAFGAQANDLDAGHFTGTAAKPLALAQGFVHVGEGQDTSQGTSRGN
jgi:uncharacterized protein YcbK (DUF882 family)